MQLDPDPPLDGPPAVAHTGEFRSVLQDGSRICIRPLRPDDAAREREFMASLSPRSRNLRGQNALAHMPADLFEQCGSVDRRDGLALVATEATAEGEFIVGVGRYAGTETPAHAEMAITIADLWQRQGLAAALAEALFRAARACGIQTLSAMIVPDNSPMLALATALGATIRFSSGEALIRAVFDLCPENSTDSSFNPRTSA